VTSVLVSDPSVREKERAEERTGSIVHEEYNAGVSRRL
jgi:hypothetical protein